MTILKKKEVVDALVLAICQTEERRLRLKTVNSILREADIPDEYYSSGIKNFFSQEFKEFYVSEEYGNEAVYYIGSAYPEAQTPSSVAAILTDILQKEGTILFAKVQPVLKDKYGIDYRDYSNGVGLEKWLEKNFPSFEKDDKNLRLRNNNSGRIFEKEYQQMNSSVFTQSWDDKLKKIYAYGDYSSKDKNILTGTIALNMAKCILGISGGFVDGTDAENPRFAFDTGIRTNTDNPIYGVVEACEADGKGGCCWQLYGFGCPGDFPDEELNIWIKKHIFTESASYASSKYSEAQKLIESIEKASDAVIARIVEWVAKVQRGEIPDEFIAGYISDFENKYTTLRAAVKELPMTDPDAELDMSAIRQIVTNNSSANLLYEAVEKFCNITDRTEALFKEKLLLNNTYTPQNDKKTVQEMFNNSFNDFDIGTFTELLNCYKNLLTVLPSSGLGENEITDRAAGSVVEHFKEIPGYLISILFRHPYENYSYLESVSVIYNLIDQYSTMADMDSNQSEPEVKVTVSTDDLLHEVINESEKVKRNWVTYIRSILPDDEVCRAVVFAGNESKDAKNNEASPGEFTLYGVGSRIYEKFSNDHRYAENYFILGLMYDARRCATALLKIYREQNDIENFRKIWTNFYQKEWAGEEDTAFWLVNICVDPDNADLWNDLQTVLKTRPQLIKKEEISDRIISGTAERSDVPAAFRAWLNSANKVPNRFEVAMAENDIDLIYSILKDKDATAELGYSDEDISVITDNLSADIPSGMNGFSIGQRIYAIQGNINGIAEKYFWNSVSDKQAVFCLFDIYSGNGDYQSALWISRNFSIDFAENHEKLKDYVLCIVKCNCIGMLEELSAHFPEIWYYDGVLEALADNQKSDNLKESSADWAGLLESAQNNRFVAPCEFETALVERDVNRVRELLASPVQMSEWGYSPEMQQKMLSLSEEPYFALGETAVDNAKKIYELQRNLHGFYENLLHSNLNGNRPVILPMIFRLLCAEKRYTEAVAYYDSYSVIYENNVNLVDYLWCLLNLGEYDSALKKAAKNPKLLFKDEALVQKIIDVAEESENSVLVSTLRRTLNNSPRNRFEESVINLNPQSIQEHISNPSKLQELGYTWNDINRFKDCFSKSYPKSNDGYSVGCRVRIFFGDQRAEQFLLDSEEDIRSARVLFDIYSKAMRWDDLCLLYRRHNNGEVWNAHYYKIYLGALIKSESKENCQALVDVFNSTSEFDMNDPEYRWIYIKALFGSGNFSAAKEQEAYVLQENSNFTPEFATPYFDMMWDTESLEEKEHAVRFASELLEINLRTLSLDAMKILATVNGHLLNDAEQEHWIDFLSDRKFLIMTHILSCCFGFIVNGKPDELERICSELLGRLASHEEIRRIDLNLLLCFEFARSAKLGKKQYTEFIDALLTVIFGIIRKSHDEFNKSEWHLIKRYFSSYSYSTKQMDSVIRSIIDFLNAENNTVPELMVIDFATNIFVKSYEIFGDVSDMPKKLSQQLSRMLKILVGCLKVRLSESDTELNDDEWKIFTSFMENVLLDDEQMQEIAAAWFENPVNISSEETDVLSRSAFFLDKITSIAQADRIVDFMISLFKNNEKIVNTETFGFIVNFLQKTDFTYDQMNSILNELSLSDVFESFDFNNLVLSLCDEKWPALSYFWLKKACVYHTDNPLLLSNLYQMLLKRAASLDPGTICDAIDLQVLYDATGENLSDANVAMLRGVYEAAEKTEQARILSVLEESLTQNNSQCIADWFVSSLEEYDVDLFEKHCKWWSRLIQLTEDDVQTKQVLQFLGLNDDPVEPGIHHSVIRLLLSDIRNTAYLKCYLRLNNFNLSNASKSKLEYFVALKEKIIIDNIIQNCCERGQYELSVRLLKDKMAMPITNSATLGQLLGNIYNEKTLANTSLFTDMVPEVYDWIDRMNKADPRGAWKNMGRAVDIALLTNRELLLLETFEDNLLSEFPGKTAVVIASLITRGEYSEAKIWTEKALNYNGDTQYLALLKKVVDDCYVTSELSAANEILVKSIPVDGNQRSLEMYGEIVFDALAGGMAKECLEAFKFLYEAEKKDKAFSACYMHLFSAEKLTDERIFELYYSVKNYFEIVQDSHVNKVAKILAVVQACLPECPQKHENIGEFISLRVKSEHIQDILEVKIYCDEYLKSVSANRDMLIQAVTGWWRIDAYVFYMFEAWSTLAQMLVEISPTAFSSACMASALNDNNNELHIEQLKNILGISPYCTRCLRNISKVSEISVARAKELAVYFDVPMEAPGVYPCIFRRILEENDSEAIQKELAIYFGIQNNFFYKNYNENMYKMKELVENEYPHHKISVNKVITLLSSSVSEQENYQKPEVYLNDKDYPTMLKAAEKWLDESTQRIQITSNETYILLGKIMTGQLDDSEKKKIKLHEFINMATLLCQYNSYTDLDILMDLCPAKWKICLRCAQELVQGCPSNILRALNNPSFRTHTGCSAFVAKLAKDFLSDLPNDKNKGYHLLVAENKKMGKDPSWGKFTSSQIIDPGVKLNSSASFTFKVTKRNFARLNWFQNDFDRYLQEMLADDAQEELRKKNKAAAKANDGEGNENVSEKDIESKDFRTVAYIQEAVNRWYPELPTEEEEIEKAREEYSKISIAGFSQEEKINHREKLIALYWNSSKDSEIRLHCVHLGLYLFDMYCDKKGLGRYANQKSRLVLYDMAICKPSEFMSNGISQKIKIGVQMCLESYNDLSLLVSDCSQNNLSELCNAINDTDVRKSFLSHIKLIREIGQMMQKTMTNQERLDALETFIRKCQKHQTAIDSSMKLTLIQLLNKQVAELRNSANVIIDVYNDTGSMEEGYIFGKIQNLGNTSVSNIQLDLNINDVFAQSYSLKKLEGNSFIPFELEYSCDEDNEELNYTLIAKYNIADDNVEQTCVYNGTLSLVDTDLISIKPGHYFVDRPVTGSNYIERPNLQNILESYYGENLSFDVLPNLAIYGMKRTGKSSILRRLKRFLRSERNEPVYVVESSGEGVKGDLIERTHSILVRQVLDGGISGEGLSNIFKEAEGWKDFYNKWKDYPDKDDSFQWIEDFYAEVSREFLTDVGLVVCVDEVESLYYTGMITDDSQLQNLSNLLSASVTVSSEQTNIWGVLSRMSQCENAMIRFVLCGSDFFTNKALEGDNLSQFFQRIKKLSVGRMNFNEIEKTMCQIEEISDYRITSDALQYLWQICGGLPWHSKIVGNEIIDKRLIPQRRTEIYPYDIVCGVQGLLNSNLHTTDSIFGLVALSEDERTIVSALSTEATTAFVQISENILYERFCENTEGNNLKGQFDRAIRTLVSERQLIKQINTKGEPYYQFGCELYRLYNRGQKILNQFSKR